MLTPEEKIFQCWQFAECPKNIRVECPAYLNHKYRFWKITDCKISPEKHAEIKEKVSKIIQLEDT